MRGQKARENLGKRNFEGGQTPLFKRLPKYGFTRSYFKRPLQALSIDKLVQFIEAGRIDSRQVIDLKVLYDSGICGHFKHGVKLLGRGLESLKRLEALPEKIQIEVTDASVSAIAAVEGVGGTLKKVHFSKLALRAHLKPERFTFLPTTDSVPQPRNRWRYAPYYDDKIQEAVARWYQFKMETTPSMAAPEATATAATAPAAAAPRTATATPSKPRT